MLKMENELVESRIGLPDDTTDVHMMIADVKAPIVQGNRITEIPVRGELAVSEGDANLEPYEGMEFESEESARIFYNAYARRVGFHIRISKYSRSRRDNSVISRRIVCSKEGFREVRVKKGVFGERRQRQRAVTRVGCKAMIMVKKLSIGRWIVSKFVKEHNHGPVPSRKVEVRIVPEDDCIVEKAIISDRDSSIQEPFEGMEFDSEEAAKSFYNSYARHVGFHARISKYCRSRRDNSIISRRIVCSKEGFREIRVKKELYDEGKVKRPRVVTRIGCKAMIIVKRLGSGKWVVSRFEKEHNHALITSKKILRLQSQSGNAKNSLSALQGSGEVPSGLLTDRCSARSQSSSRESLTILYNQLCNEAIKYAQEGAATEDSYNVAMAALKEAIEKVAAAKRSAVTLAQHGNLASGTSQGVIINQIGLANLHGPIYSAEGKQAIPPQELVLLQQPVNYLLIPSLLASDSCHQNHTAETPSIINMPNGQIIHTSSDGIQPQRIQIINPISVQKQPLSTPSREDLVANGTAVSSLPCGRKRKLQAATDRNKENSDATSKSQKRDSVGMGQTNSTQSSSNSLGLGFPETQLVAIPAVPLTLYVPVVGSLPAAYSVATQGMPATSYAFLAAPIEELPLSACPSETSTASLVKPPSSSKPYTGPNPQVHAAAIAAGARIVPPLAAASLIKAVESRIRAGGGSFLRSTFIANPKPLSVVKPPTLQSCKAQRSRMVKRAGSCKAKRSHSTADVMENLRISAKLPVVRNSDGKQSINERLQLDVLDASAIVEDLAMFGEMADTPEL